ncbi:enoyl-CoA hydratase/isomerase family protein [Pseudomonas sp. NY15364]|uniref:enoyl-CoA hydratase/isomerase family protein n=1 Tax=Pseudomonas sp. NY15364 TaxID=3400353 RepID=UPI003A89C684
MNDPRNDSGGVSVRREGPVAVLAIDRVHKHNALSPVILQQLDTQLTLLQDAPEVRVLVLTGEGERAFIAGNDIEHLAQVEAHEAFALMESGQRLVSRLRNYSKPVVAMINGYALGGGLELALACDFIVASRRASFGFPEIRLNTFPGWGGTQLAVRAIGLARAKEMIMSGRRYSAEEAWEMGLVNRLCDPAGLRRETLAFATSLIERDATCLSLAKRLCNGAEDWTFADGLASEAALYGVNFSREQARDGLRAFLGKSGERNNG